jgi:hypothetical protein
MEKSLLMKYTLLLLLIPVLTSAQIDISRVTMTSDSTLTVRDTSYWTLHTAQVQVNTRQVRLFQADLIQISGGRKAIPKTIGPLPLREFREACRAERDQLNAELQTIQAALHRIAARRDELNALIQTR